MLLKERLPQISIGLLILLVLLIIGIILELFGFNIIPPDEVEVVAELPALLEQACERQVTDNLSFSTIETTEHLIKGQVIVMGVRSEVETRIEAVDSETYGELTPLVECDFSSILPQDVQNQIEPQTDVTQSLSLASLAKFEEAFSALLTASDNDPFVVRLYEFQNESEGNNSRAPELAADLNNSGGELFADPNYLTGHLANSYCQAGGSPHGAEGSPHGAEGSGGGIKLDVPADEFDQQWAFKNIQFFDDTGKRPTPTGKGVTVAVFDTSPYLPGAAVTNEMTPTLSLQMARPSFYMTYTAPITASTTMRDHGLFVSSLVHSVAPDSEIHLIEVLDDRGCGSLDVLNAALMEYIGFRFVSQETIFGSFDNTVVNLSLGVTFPDKDTDAEGSSAEDSDGESVDEDLLTLEFLMFLINKLGGVVVSAAGNERMDGTALPAQYPARFDNVIGVAASNQANDLACFANNGDIAAPGGDAQDSGSASCEAKIISCSMTGSDAEKTCLVGLASSSSTSYAYWRGSSFATPLVSGTVALLLEDNHVAETNIRPMLISTPSGTEGVTTVPLLNVQEALDRAGLP